MPTFINYLYWQFILNPQKILQRIRTFLVFGFDFFSVKESFFNLFSPWRRQISYYGNSIDIARFFEALTTNIISRIIGFIMRIFLFLFFIAYEAIILIIGSIIFIITLTYPILAIYLITIL
jgi:hypothetical protein